MAEAQTAPKVELSVIYWHPVASMQLSSDAPEIPGTPIDLKGDMSVSDRGFPAVAVAFRPAARHRVMLEYIPIRYDATASIPRTVTFSGATYSSGDRVASTFAWDAINVGYEYDFAMRPRFEFGVVVEAKSTVVRQELRSASADRSRRTSVPAPAVGFVARSALGARVSLYGEARGFAVPDGQNGHYGGRYVDVDGGAAVALASHVGVRAGIRWLNIRHLGESDSTRLSLAGAYAGMSITSR